jgi:hypothetical protein
MLSSSHILSHLPIATSIGLGFLIIHLKVLDFKKYNIFHIHGNKIQMKRQILKSKLAAGRQ